MQVTQYSELLSCFVTELKTEFSSHASHSAVRFVHVRNSHQTRVLAWKVIGSLFSPVLQGGMEEVGYVTDALTEQSQDEPSPPHHTWAACLWRAGLLSGLEGSAGCVLEPGEHSSPIPDLHVLARHQCLFGSSLFQTRESCLQGWEKTAIFKKKAPWTRASGAGYCSLDLECLLKTYVVKFAS